MLESSGHVATILVENGKHGVPMKDGARAMDGAEGSVRNLDKSFGPLKAVDGVSVDIASGEFLA